MKTITTTKPKTDLKYEFKSTMLVGNEMFVENPHERFPCSICGKSYLRKRHLQRHMRDECVDIPPRFSCELCPSRFRRKYHMVRHLTSKHGIPPPLVQNTTNSSSGGRASASSSRSARRRSNVGGCSARPENLSMRKKDHYESDNNMAHSPPLRSAASTHAADVDGVMHAERPTYGLTGAITAISAATVMTDSQIAQAAEGINEEIARSLVAANAEAGAVGGRMAASNALDAMDEEWKMKLGIQLISNSLLKERLINTMPFTYNN